MTNKALSYAENTLGVHTVYEELTGNIEQLDVVLADLDKAQDRRRGITDKMADREVELTNEMRGVHPNMSDTRFKSEWKGWERTDEVLSALRRDLLEVQGEIQGIEFDVEILRHRIKAGCARVEQLGGYLHYLAAVKLQVQKNQAEQRK